ncbi:MAG: beta-galactosidase [Chloroflexi bacterium]|nr:beta-galactosidase [Chloroflexota bacterium]
MHRAQIVRAIAIFVVLALTAPPHPLVVLGPPQTVTTRHPVVCAHTRLTDEVEEWKIQRTLAMVREMGAPWIVEYFPWAYVERSSGAFDWRHTDQVIEHAENQGLTVIARLGLVPEWARQRDDREPTTDTYLDEAHYADFGDYVFQFVRRYTGRVHYIIIWNEPNITLEWGYRPVDPAGYVALLKIAYARAKEADPGAQVLAGALAPTLEPVGSPFGMNDLDYLRAMYAAGAAPYFDSLALHAYGLVFPPDDPPAPDAINFRRVELLRAIMIANGDGDKPAMITESGWNDSPRWTKAVKPGARIDYTIGSYDWAETYWPWVKAVCTWAFRFPAPLHSYGDYYAFVTPEFTERPIYSAIKDWANP